MATGSILAPPPPDKAQALTDSSVKAAIGEAKKVKTAAVRPDGSLVNPEPPAKKSASKVAHLKEAPHGEFRQAGLGQGRRGQSGESRASEGRPSRGDKTAAAPVKGKARRPLDAQARGQ